MPTIYIPEMVSKPTRCANHIEEVGTEIEKTINQTVQNTLNSLERDCDHIAELVRNCVLVRGHWLYVHVKVFSLDTTVENFPF